MIAKEHIAITTKDCTKFILDEGQERVIQHFTRTVSRANTFWFSVEGRDTDNLAVAEYDYLKGEWRAGRMVGESVFYFEDAEYKITIKPRFGELFLFRMLEEIFNVKLADSNTAFNRNLDFQYLIKKLISFLWLNMLAKANKHGLPRNTVSKTYKGQIVKGRVNIPKSIKHYYISNEVVSNYREKETNSIVARILNQAYDILIKDYFLGTLQVPRNAEDAIIQLECATVPPSSITKHEYVSIRYKDIYQSYKPVVDFSWELIQRKQIANSLHNHATKQGYSFFIDMAEIWELYLRSILKKHFTTQGWVLRNDKLLAYGGKYFERMLIPDIVFQRNNDLMVWDAKYKHMNLDRIDFDRSDFFQIHTYIHYYQQSKNVIAGGLLFPFSVPITEETTSRAVSDTLFGSNAGKTDFLIDGIDLSFLDKGSSEQLENKKQFMANESQFISRLDKLILAS